MGEENGGRLWLALKEFTHRTLRESASFATARDHLVPNPYTWEHLWAGLDCTIAETPTVGEQVDETPFWIVTTEYAPAWGLPRLRILYSFDEQFLDMLEIDYAE